MENTNQRSECNDVINNLSIDQLGMAFEKAYTGIIITSRNPKGVQIIRYCNPSFCRMTGYSKDELIGQSPKILQGPETNKYVIASLKKAVNQSSYWEGDAINYRKDGEKYHVKWNINPLKDIEGNLDAYISFQTDITNEKVVENYNQVLLAAFHEYKDPVMITNEQMEIVFINEAFEKDTGYKQEEVVGKKPGFLSSNEHNSSFYRSLYNHILNGKKYSETFINKAKDGSLIYLEQTISPIRNSEGVVTHYLSISRNITNEMREKTRLIDEASKDSMTGLYNRRSGDKCLKNKMKKLQTIGQRFSVIIMDIDNFKLVNDKFGHIAGDGVIVFISEKIKQSIRDSDFAVRWGGEEFIIITSDDEKAGFIVAERIRRLIEASEAPGVGSVTASFGISQSSCGDTSVHDVIDRADKALYLSKRTGKNKSTIYTRDGKK